MKLTQWKQLKRAEFSFFWLPFPFTFLYWPFSIYKWLFALVGFWIRCLSSAGVSIFSPCHSSPSTFSLDSPDSVSLFRGGTRGWTKVSKEKQLCLAEVS